MKILIVATHDIIGGAARASYTLLKAMHTLRAEARMLVMKKSGDEPTIIPADIQTSGWPTKFHKISYFLLQKHFQSNRTSVSNTTFSLPYPRVDISNHPAVKDADILNLHWVAGFLTPEIIRKILDIGKPIVWTLHDQMAYTGGCHYASGCNKFQDTCRHCPQLKNDLGIPHAIVMSKSPLYKNVNLTICAPSEWVSDAVKKSKIMQGLDVVTIPYAIDHRAFKPLPKTIAKKKFSIPSNAFTIIFGAHNGDERRKGFSFLIEALKLCFANDIFSAQAKIGRIRLLVMGTPNEELKRSNWPITFVGDINGNSELNLFYSAGDILISPSIEDTLPLTLLEAMAAGTPAIAFDSKTAGMRDVITSEKDGIMVKSGDSTALAEAMISLFLYPKRLKLMQTECRRTIERRYFFTREAQDYLDLFHKILAKGKSKKYNKLDSRLIAFSLDRVLAWTFFRLLFTMTFYQVGLKLVYDRLKRVTRRFKKKAANKS